MNRATRPTLTASMGALSACFVLVAANACTSKNNSTAPGATSSEATARASFADAADAGGTRADLAHPDGGSGEPLRAASVPANLNVILVSIDSLRADMPWAGYPRNIAPNLSALEKKSVVFTRSYSTSSYTSMSLGGLLAGRYPSELKRDGFFFGTYPKENLFFPELLQNAGVHTMGAHAHGYFKDAGFQQGFDQWELVPNLRWNNLTDENVTSGPHEKIAEKLLSTALGTAARVGADASSSAAPSNAGASEAAAGNARFFAWFHFLDPHDIYMGHEQDGIPSFGPKQRDKYDAEVLYTDQKLGDLFAFIEQQPWKDRTAIIITADHGEAFGEHKQFLHGFEVWENLVHVPLFFYVPGVAPAQLHTPVSGIDLAPTILEMLGVQKDTAMEGRSLFSAIKTGIEPAQKDVVVDLPETSDNDQRRAVISGDKKIIAFGTQHALKMFDLAADPSEEHAVTSGPDFDAMAARYTAASASIPEVAPYACKKDCLNRAYLKQKAPEEKK